MKIVSLLLIMTTMLLSSPLSVHNNNPVNIKYDKRNVWNGQKGKFKGFVVFTSKEYGLRASRRIIRVNIRATKSVNCFVLRFASEPSGSIHSKHLRNYARAIKKLVGRDYLLESDTERLLPLIVRLEGGIEAYKYYYGRKKNKCLK